MMLLVGENEVQAHQLDLHREGLTPTAIAVVFVPDGPEKWFGSYMVNQRPIGGLVDAEMSLDQPLLDQPPGSSAAVAFQKSVVLALEEVSTMKSGEA